MSKLSTRTFSVDLPTFPGLSSVAVIGAAGGHAQSRIIPALKEFPGLATDGFDLRPTANSPIPIEEVRGSREGLRLHLIAARPDVAYIATTHPQHGPNILAALEAGVRLILCEKPIADNLADAEWLLPHLEAALPWQFVYFVDQYRLLPPAVALHHMACDRLGEFVRMRVSLLEEKPISAAEVEVHRAGMGGMLHHAVAMLAQYVDLEELQVSDATWARHPLTPSGVPDSYRSVILTHRHTGKIVLSAEVGKYLRDHKVIEIVSTRGVARYDRATGRIILYSSSGQPVQDYKWSPDDNGYAALFASFVHGSELPPSIMAPREALAVTRLLSQAQQVSRQLSNYPPFPSLPGAMSATDAVW